jgi:hypothetical protein
MTTIFVPGEEYTPGVAAAFTELLAALAENRRQAYGAGVMVTEGDDDDLRTLLSLDTDLPIQVLTTR